MRFSFIVLTAAALLSGSSRILATPVQAPAQTEKPARVEITPARLEAEVGQRVTFAAAGYADDGRKLDAHPTAWFATPFDIAAADEQGRVTFFLPGEAKVGAVIGGKPGFAIVTIKPQRIARIDLAPPAGPVAVGDVITLPAVARTANGDPRTAAFEWTSSASSVPRPPTPIEGGEHDDRVDPDRDVRFQGQKHD